MLPASMRGCVVSAAVALVFLWTPLGAQWPPYRTPGAPRAADGRPDPNAPAPRTTDGRPDLSGIWQNFRKPGQAAVRSVNAAFFDDLPPTLVNEFRLRPTTLGIELATMTAPASGCRVCS